MSDQVPPQQTSASQHVSAKQALRDVMASRRAQAAQTAGAQAGEAVRATFLTNAASLGIGAGAEIAGYWPIGDEMDTRPLMTALANAGFALSLPVVTAPDAPLSFRRWRMGDALESGPLGTRHPAATAKTVVPDVVLVPLLAFDASGLRLGWGGGYYDRTLAALDALAIGIAFDVQRVDAVPRETFDQPLAWVVSEHEALKCRN